MKRNSYDMPSHTETIPVKGCILQLKIEEIYAEKAEEGRLKRNESIRLAQSIQKYGVSTPLVVTPVEAFPNFYRYRVLKGAEIWRAAGIAGVDTLPCIISDEPPQDPEIAVIFAEIRTKKLHIFEQAAAIEHLLKKHGLTRARIARETGLSPSAIANKLRLCRLLPVEQHAILRAGLTERHARTLLRLPSTEMRTTAIQKMCNEHLSVSAAEALVERLLAGATPHEERTLTQQTATQARKIPANKPPTGNICPNKFILHSLKPLYNSLERTLGIFRKTGRGAEMSTQENEDGILITIHIPAAR